MTASRELPKWLVRVEHEVRPHQWARARCESPVSALPSPDVPAQGVEVERERLLFLERALAEAEDAASRATAEAQSARAEVEALRARERALEADVAAARAELETFTATMLRDAERELVRLATALAGRVVGRELASDPLLIVAWAREAIAQSALGESFEIALSPDIGARLQADDWGELAPRARVDAALPAETCELRDGPVTLTSSSKSRLELVVEHAVGAGEREAA